MATDINPPECPRHPGVAAPYVCSRCQTAACVDCCYSMPDGTVCCRSCYETPAVAVTAGASDAPPAIPAAPEYRSSGLRLRITPAQTQVDPVPTTPLPPGAGCVQHPDVPPLAACQRCGARACRTCLFVFPGNLQLCPACASAPQSTLSPRRRKYLITAYIMAGWATLCMIVLLSGILAVLGNDILAEMLLGILLMVFVMVPAIIGTGMAMSAMRKGANTIAIWIVLAWNSLLFGGFMLMAVVGNFME